jgi:hypothetical protein
VSVWRAGRLWADIRCLRQFCSCRKEKPYLPNSPSILLIDDTEIQFTIPMRANFINKVGAAKFELLGILQMTAKREPRLPSSFSEVFQDLGSNGSLRVQDVIT